MRKFRNTESFIRDCIAIHGNKYTYEDTEFVKRKDNVEINCVKHGKFEIKADNLLSGKGCMKCAVEKRADLRRDTTEDFIEKSRKVHGDKYDYSISVYVLDDVPLNIRCPIHGDFSMTPDAHKHSQGCSKCANVSRSKKHSDTLEDFVRKAKLTHGDKYIYSEVDYVGSKSKVKIICPSIGHGAFYQQPDNHIEGQGCPICQPGGFNSKLMGYVYVLQAGNITKVGITNKLPEQRCKKVSDFSKKSFEVVTSYHLEGCEARRLEKSALLWLAENYEKQEDKFNGSTECFLDVDLTALIFKIEQLK